MQYFSIEAIGDSLCIVDSSKVWPEENILDIVVPFDERHQTLLYALPLICFCINRAFGDVWF
jgi:hypothetical protein